MPTILAIETSSEIASVALLHGTQLIQRESSGVQTHSQTVLPMVQSVLAEAGIKLNQCNAIAFGAGPGSFTGVRTACGITQGLAFGAAIPVIPVVTLLAAAVACRQTSTERDVQDVLVLLDARMNEVYWAQYRYQGQTGRWQIVSAPALAAAADVRAQGQVITCGNGLSAYATSLDATVAAMPGRPDLMPHAAQIAQLGRAAFIRGETLETEQAQPFYLRNKIAFTSAERALKAAKAAA
ncbi:MAG: tRNA (adenosine(37)-N6)-threonylcarbamoyltransferase complex dimerization subunit type 1 TsaB [Pseudomonadota bacterium]